MRSRYKITEKDGIYFITSSIVWWIPVFTSQKYFDILIDSFKFCQREKGLKIYAYTILDNHFHAIVAALKLSNIIQSLKSFTAKQIIEQLKKDDKRWLLNILAWQKKPHKEKSEHQVWQEGFHPQLIFSEEMLVQKIEYIHYNILKRGIVTCPEHWRYSSAGCFAGEKDVPLIVDPLPI